MRQDRQKTDTPCPSGTPIGQGSACREASTLPDPTRGITCPDMRRVIRAALHGGWMWLGMSGTTHARIQWTDGTVKSFGTTPGVASWKTVATEIQNVSGVTVWRKGNKRRSRRADQTSGFDLEAAAREARARNEANERADSIRRAAYRAEAERRRRLAAAERNRIDIERLMRPGD